MRSKDELEGEFDKLVAIGPDNQNFGDAGIRNAIGLLGKALLRLDRTSTRLAIVSIGLTVVFLLLGITQVAIMLRGR